MSKVPISVFILTFNEEKNLRGCLESIVPFADEVCIVDSFSSDGTLAIAQSFGVKVWQHKFTTFGAQRNWALKEIPFRNPWLFTLDADHRVTKELWTELRAVASLPSSVHGLFVNRRQIFRGRWIRFGGYYPKYLLKIFRKEGAKFAEDELDDKVYVKGETRILGNDIIEDNLKEADMGFWIEKHNGYASRMAEEELKIRVGAKQFHIDPKFFGNPNERSLWLKLRWYKLPLFLRPFLFFFYRYFLRFGFLDGKEGFIFYFFQTFWFRILVDIKLEELLKKDSNTTKEVSYGTRH